MNKFNRRTDADKYAVEDKKKDKKLRSKKKNKLEQEKEELANSEN